MFQYLLLGLQTSSSDQITADATVFAVVISILSLALSAVVAYRQLHISGPAVTIVNNAETQMAVALTYDKLPQSVRDQFPAFSERPTNFAICSVVFGNDGDRVGYAHILSITCDPSDIATSQYNYLAIPPGTIITHQVLLRNIRGIGRGGKRTVNLTVNYETGRLGRRKNRARKQTNVVELTIEVSSPELDIEN